ncbi:Hybrid polyketide synthase/ nonribosomal peptide synthetase [Purpureocillium lavendulum]|uniref:Hybrid polyketide synthase/ nonribosomal peptide synthetase n=1 Tax=Purpureocillium lavendulum TaxID=1247861 RepID=A0AB34FMZ5_9HYPO|nr:Hybrid polyketide synthase/ nonribosomal peptide synthetase [Purpureocillium lavendulum]
MAADKSSKDPQWDPSTKEEMAAKKALEDLIKSHDKVLKPGGANGKNRFILRTKGYYDLRAYVLTGKEFPRTIADFEARMPKTSLQELDKIQPKLYETTRDAIIAIGQSCHEYSLITATQKTVQFCVNAIGLLDEEKAINLKYQLDNLLDPKLALAGLRDEAKEKERSIDEVKETIISFRGETIRRKGQIHELQRLYESGPVTNAVTKDVPYLKYLNQSLAEHVEKVKSLVAQANKDYDDWDESKNRAIGFAFLGPLGWIAMGLKAARAAEDFAAYIKAINEANTLQKQNEVEATLIEHVSQMLTQSEGIERKMTDAIGAMTELSELFQEQANCYDRIVIHFGGMHKGTKATTAALRKRFVMTKMDQAIAKVRELRDLATEVANTILHELPGLGKK